MSIEFDFYETPDPEGGDNKKYHVRTVNYRTVGTNELAGQIQLATSLTKADIKAVLVALNESIAFHLGQSHRVHLEGIGYFSAALKYVRDMTLKKHGRKVSGLKLLNSGPTRN